MGEVTVDKCLMWIGGVSVMRQKLVRKLGRRAVFMVMMYNVECTGSGNNGICNCKE